VLLSDVLLEVVELDVVIFEELVELVAGRPHRPAC
jgi:hypothetical protein